ncbi:hypothetical protein [Amycolatopsis nigrescens]|uniref:hypothetical protein n=1 Tax=Amycolatopsis nigrescens TaxID=381445 RepID=UPI000373F1CB|nr:hypothetical protein [Amycolatopsis nigrescens]
MTGTERTRLQPADSSRFGVVPLAKEQDWEAFSKVPGASWSNRQAGSGDFGWPMPELPPGTAQYVYLGVEGRYDGHEFSAHQLRKHVAADYQKYGSDRRIEDRSVLWLKITEKVPTCTFGIPRLTPWKITRSNARTELGPEFSRWFRRNQFRFRKFRSGPGTLTLELGPQLTAGDLVRGLEFLLDVAERIPFER